MIAFDHFVAKMRLQTISQCIKSIASVTLCYVIIAMIRYADQKWTITSERIIKIQPAIGVMNKWRNT